MTCHRSLASPLAVLVALVVSAPPLAARAPQTARDRYQAARVREVDVRAQAEGVPAAAPAADVDRAVREARRVVVQYENVVRRFPTSGYSDNALFLAATLSQWLHSRFGQERDRTAAVRYLEWLEREYPGSRLRRAARSAAQVLASPPPESRERAAPAPVVRPQPVSTPAAPTIAVTAFPASGTPATLQAIDRQMVDGRVRVTLTLDRETTYTHELLSTPLRAFVDLAGATAAEPLREAALRYDSDAVRQVRVGRQAGAVRVVLDLAERSQVSVFTLYNPFRVVLDAESASAPPAMAPVSTVPLAVSAASAASVPAPRSSREAPPPPPPPPSASPPPTAGTPAPSAVIPAPSAVIPSVAPVAPQPEAAEVAARAPLPPPAAPDTAAQPTDSPPIAPAPGGAPVVPSANADGSFSIARQLGLGVSRIVIDPGHGGHDPGTLTSGTTEARLVLDVALRLEKLLAKEGFDVVLTRRTDVFVPLEERTALANRDGADLFLSIHANSGRDPAARGIEVYYLSFASNPDAEAVAARENATATGAMHNLPNIVRAIALNNKLDESRDFAQLVQRSLVLRLSKLNEGMRNRGVKKAPFVVLIGANMPSVLAEIGFITNRQDAALIKTPAYRQRIAEALHAAVVQYQRTLKRQGTVAAR